MRLKETCIKEDEWVTQYSRENLGRKKGTRKMWVKKTDLKCLVAYTSVKNIFEYDWYFDNGCLRHMTSIKTFLMNYKRCSVGMLLSMMDKEVREMEEEL